jgi:TRAP-type transport system periplasmic protein
MSLPLPLRLLALVAVLVLALAACGEDDDPTGVVEEVDPDMDLEDAADEVEEQLEEAEEQLEEQIDGEPVTLTLGHPFPATHVIVEDVLEPFAAQLAELSGGSLEIEMHPGGALGPGPAVYENVVAGAQDLGFSLHGYTPGRFPVAQVVELPFMFPDGAAEQATEALWELYEEFPEFQAEYDDVKVIAMWTHEPGQLWTSGERVEALEDVGGLVIRAPGPVSANLIEELGASAESMPAPESYDALERGVIDGVMIGENGVRDFSLYEVLDFGVACDCYTSPMFVVMNLDRWEQLSSEQQGLIDEFAGRPLSIQAAQAYDAARAQAVEVLDDAGIEMVDLGADELERWRDTAQPVIDGWIADREAEGVPAGDMVDRLLGIVGLDG